jgi:tripartite-type tricarboxylate transporter receptor subunit TctC
MRRALGVAALAWACAAVPGFAQEPSWPTRPVRVLVPYSVGGATDIVIRLIQPALGEMLGQPIVVENRPSATGNLAVEAVAKAAPDGHTVLIGNITTNAINPAGLAHVLKFDPTKDLVGVTLLVSIPTIVVAAPNLPANSFKELIDYARAHPGELNYSNPLYAYSHLDTLELSRRTGIQVVPIPSKGAGPTVTAIMNGEIHFSFLNAASVMAYVKSGKMKALATTAPQRLPELPNVPTMAEVGFPDVGSNNWNAFFLPAKTPRAIVNRLHALTLQVMRRKDIQDLFVKASLPIVLSSTPEEFQQFLDAEMKKWSRIIKENNIRMSE